MQIFFFPVPHKAKDVTFKILNDIYPSKESPASTVGEGFRGRTIKLTSLPGFRDECLAVKMDDGERGETTQDFRVRVSSKRDVSERLDRCKEILRTAMDGQPEMDEESKRFIVQELLAVSDVEQQQQQQQLTLRTVPANR